MRLSSNVVSTKPAEVLVVGEVLGVPAPCPSVEAALVALLAGPPPAALCFDPAEEEGKGLELLEALENLSLSIPVLLPLPPREGRANFFTLSPSVAWVPRPASLKVLGAITERVAASLEAEPETKAFKTSDYLKIAVLFGLSLRFHFRYHHKDEVLINLVGGDVWSVFSGVQEADRALRDLFFDAPETVEVAPITVLPKHRQIRASGVDFLLRCEDSASRRVGPPTTTSMGGTQPIETRVVEEIRSNLAAGESPEVIDSFERHFTEGIRAALAQDYDSAVSSFRQALTLRPNDSRAQANLNRVLKSQG